MVYCQHSQTTQVTREIKDGGSDLISLSWETDNQTFIVNCNLEENTPKWDDQPVS